MSNEIEALENPNIRQEQLEHLPSVSTKISERSAIISVSYLLVVAATVILLVIMPAVSFVTC